MALSVTARRAVMLFPLRMSFFVSVAAFASVGSVFAGRPVVELRCAQEALAAVNGNPANIDTIARGQDCPLSEPCEIAVLRKDVDASFTFPFPSSVATDGDWVAIGDPQAPCPGNTSTCGAVHLFRRSGTSWLPFATLLPDVLDVDFGSKVAMNGDRLIVGASYYQDFGAAFVFRWNGTSWEQEQRLVPALVDPSIEQYGAAVAIDFDFAVVGAARGECSDELCGGAVYVFFFDGCLGEWIHVDTLQGSEQVDDDDFGRSVAIDGDRIVVGAPGANLMHPVSDCCVAHDSPGCSTPWCSEAACLNLPECCTGDWGESCAAFAQTAAAFCNCTLGSEGWAYEFRRTGFVKWEETSVLYATNPTAGDAFGTSVAVLGNVVAIGAPFADSAFQPATGAVYLYRIDDKGWFKTDTLIPEAPQGGTMFGSAIAMSPAGVLVGATDAHCTSFLDCDLAYLFRHDGDAWVESRLASPPGTFGTQFGAGVALSDRFGVVSAPEIEFPFPDQGHGAAFVYAAGVDDCDCNGVGDLCERLAGAALDCNLNDRLDTCDIAEGVSEDCNGDGVPNECDTDCQKNGVPDGCDIASGKSADCNHNVYPDECELAEPDCNRNGIADEDELRNPATVFYDGFEKNTIEPTLWPVAENVQVQNFGISQQDQFVLELYDGGVLESKSIDLFGAYLATLEFDVFNITSSYLAVNVEYWDGESWRALRREVIGDGGDLPVRVLDLPQAALHREFKFRFRSLTSEGAGIVDDIRVTRFEGDCNRTHVLDSCEVSACGVKDCNENGAPDECDFELFRLGHRDDYDVPKSPQVIASGDFDRDGDVDLLIGRGGPGSSENSIVTMLNQGDGIFELSTESHHTIEHSARSIVVADLDDDGDLDFIFGGSPSGLFEGGVLGIVKNRGGVWSGWAAPVLLDVPAAVMDVVLGDVNGDSHSDLLAVLSEGLGNGGHFYVALGNEDGEFFERLNFTFGITPRSLSLFDMEHDGDLDVVIADQFDRFLWVLRNDVAGELDENSFSVAARPLVSHFNADQPFYVTTADFNGDTFADIALVNAYLDNGEPFSATVAIFLNRGADDGKWLGLSEPIEYVVPGAAFAIEAQDLNADGWMDAVVVSREANQLRVLLNRGTDQEGKWLGLDDQAEPIATGSYPVHVALVDLNGDETPDVVTADRATDNEGFPVGSPSVSIFRQVPAADRDCNGNEVPDRCDIADGHSLDCNGDSVPDECQPDCDGNTVPDDCDIAGGAADCLGNGIPDLCEVIQGTALDCNSNEVPDECEAVREFHAESGYIYPLYSGVPLEYLSFEIANPPLDLFYGAWIELDVSMNRNSTTVVSVYLNGETVASTPVQSLSVCPLAPDHFEFEVPALNWRQAVSSGHVSIGLSTNTSSSCTHPSSSLSEPYALIKVSYLVDGPNDINLNFIPDECDVDFDRDRDVDLFDVGIFTNCYGEEAFGSKCSIVDFNGDGIALVDFAAIPSRMTGPK